jgi:uncharacterized protein (TIGR02145 family)
MKKLIRILVIPVLFLLITGCKEETTITDIDGNVYNTVKIGEQVWLKENLKVTKFNDGTPIPDISDITEWRHNDAPGYCWYDNDIKYKDPYGALYNWHAAGDRDDLCPTGWHVPGDEEWKELEMSLGMSREQADGTVWRGTDQGGKCKETGTEHWAEPNKGATNESGLTILGTGRRFTSGLFGTMHQGSTYWTSTQSSQSSAVYRHFASGNAGIGRNPAGEKKFGFPVRCVKDKK